MLYTDRQLLRLTLPLFAEQFLVVLVGVADTLMVAYAGEAAVSGVALVDTISFLVSSAFGALCTGGAVIASQYKGSGDQAKIALTARLLLLCSAGVGTLLAVVACLGGRGLLGLIFGSVDADVMQAACDYFWYVGISYPFLAVYSAVTALYRSQGNSMISMVASLIMNVENIIGNYLCIHLLNMGAGGAALSTLIARATVSVFLLGLLLHTGALHGVGHATRAECRALLRQILWIGVPSGLESLLFNGGKLLVQQLYAALGTVALAANAGAGALSSIATLPGGAISLAMLPVVGQAVGAGRFDEARRLTHRLLLFAYALMLGTNLLVYVFLPQLSGLYGLSAETTAVVRELLFWHCIFATLFYPAGFCIPAALRAAGDVRFPMLVSMVSMLVFRVGFSYLFVRGLGLGVVSIWAAIFIDWGVRGALYILRFRSGKWQTKRVVQ